MTRLTVPDMTCGHCKASIAAAIEALDPAARLEIDLPGRRVEVRSAASDDAILSALRARGFDASLTA
ncbi:hypothetical protein OCGS_2690 [Oceaniovalibus guishaninsula JLT2003]|uniref:HMA domain-containing protein n=1 Tax=Oceaniovalibus guishaninsula JLT2003 TaxID=1231392 RepID=K2HJD3_9RHOB|nr:heavy-metal-associated domain-containing protein [Oceaniovalibus guishaninsula]EKE43099.1 hypothetical protein OCGS_2690 [Oceaniovalibus guishaninsula JLT2003]